MGSFYRVPFGSVRQASNFTGSYLALLVGVSIILFFEIEALSSIHFYSYLFWLLFCFPVQMGRGFLFIVYMAICWREWWI